MPYFVDQKTAYFTNFTSSDPNLQLSQSSQSSSTLQLNSTNPFRSRVDVRQSAHVRQDARPRREWDHDDAEEPYFLCPEGESWQHLLPDYGSSPEPSPSRDSQEEYGSNPVIAFTRRLVRHDTFPILPEVQPAHLSSQRQSETGRDREAEGNRGGREVSFNPFAELASKLRERPRYQQGEPEKHPSPRKLTKGSSSNRLPTTKATNKPDPTRTFPSLSRARHLDVRSAFSRRIRPRGYIRLSEPTRNTILGRQSVFA